jgi:hypothetical protein
MMSGSHWLQEANGFHVAFGDAKLKTQVVSSIVACHQSSFRLLSAKVMVVSYLI